MTPGIEYLDLDDLLYLAGQLFGEPPPVRDVGLLGSAAARPQTTVLGMDAYQSIWEKAAALFQSLLKNHAMVDGNKRLGWVATAVFLEINDVSTTHVSDDRVYEFVIDVAAGRHEIDEIAGALSASSRNSQVKWRKPQRSHLPAGDMA